MIAGLSAVDLFAFAVFAIAWAGYSWFADRRFAEHGLMGATARHRIRWMEQMLARENRIYDSTLVANISRSPNFFAQTSLIILGGLIAVIGAGERVSGLVAEVPFAQRTEAAAWHLKLGIEVIIFIYAFFKFTWSMRQFNYLMIVMGAAPPHGSDAARQEGRAVVARAARMSDIATENFNSGIRAYYFGLAALGWFVHPLLLAAASALVVLVLWRREFHSRTLAALKD
ncbi:MAG: DUF599 domain-containing protein [Alphaproteobacteria bacterium]|nr:DUF599 domain-containing protein [Alphaproteobacteria bacterium]